jgi:M6 family metalloprotease-like protein
MKICKPSLWLAIILLASSISLMAVPATPYPIQRQMPDGSELTVFLRGDEFFSYYLSEDGYLIQQDDQGFFRYIQTTTQGMHLPTNVRVRPIPQRTIEEQQLINTLQSHPDLSSINQQRRVARAAEDGGEPQKTFPRTGNPKSLVILVNFADVSFVIPNPKQAFTDLLNKEGYAENGGTGSARDYFRESSFGVSAPEFVVVGPYTLTRNREYYGGNNSSDNDQRPRDMVIDACRAAHNDGVDFSIYDTDGDGIVDNVFIYYAGHNEAEGGPKESIWPHRWQLNTNLTLDGVRVVGYACTSELRGSSGANMCGIGTFAHEFGHVYGLVDYYPTNGASHHTLSNWNIMDAGAYLNLGRTPPSLSAYDRFFIGWLTPTLLKSPQDVTIPDLKATNKAYIITPTDAHNMNGSNPNPVEFITFEYRSKTGWDAFLPNSGMLVTRIVFNSADWKNNGPNNDPNRMGVDIIEADGIASRSTLQGDVFPGTSNVTSFNPTTRAGVNMNKPLTYIKEENNTVTFRFMGGGNPPTIKSSQDSIRVFSTVLDQDPPLQEFFIAGSNLTAAIQIGFTFNKHFELKLKEDASDNWTRSLTLQPVADQLDTTYILIRYNPKEASHNDFHYEFLISSSDNADTRQTALTGQAKRPIYVIAPVANEVSISSLDGFTASWNKVFDASGYYFTVFTTSQGSSSSLEEFNNGLNWPEGWDGKASSIINNPSYAGDAVPSIEFKNTGDFLETELYPIPVSKFSFYIRSIGEDSGFIKVEAHDGVSWEVLDMLAVRLSLNTYKQYPVDNPAHRKFRISFTKGSSSVAIDDMGAYFDKKLNFIYNKKWVTDTTYTVQGIVPSNVYFYKVMASDRTLNPDQSIRYENITGYSNTVEVRFDMTNIIQFSRHDIGFEVYKDQQGNIQLAVKDTVLLGQILYIYDGMGRLIDQLPINAQVMSLPILNPNQLYILRSPVGSLKILL